MFVFPFLPNGGNEVPHRFHGVGPPKCTEYYICWWFFILLTGQYFGFLLWHLGVSSHVLNIYRGGTFIELWGGGTSLVIYATPSYILILQPLYFFLCFFMFCFCFQLCVFIIILLLFSMM
jgi:hypothetical protein